MHAYIHIHIRSRAYSSKHILLSYYTELARKRTCQSYILSLNAAIFKLAILEMAVKW